MCPCTYSLPPPYPDPLGTASRQVGKFLFRLCEGDAVPKACSHRNQNHRGQRLKLLTTPYAGLKARSCTVVRAVPTYATRTCVTRPARHLPTRHLPVRHVPVRPTTHRNLFRHAFPVPVASGWFSGANLQAKLVRRPAISRCGNADCDQSLLPPGLLAFSSVAGSDPASLRRGGCLSPCDPPASGN